MDVVVDASVALKWVVDEEGSEAAAALATLDLCSPELFLAESANALWAKRRRGELTASEAAERMRLLRIAPVELIPLEDLVEAAILLALRLGHPVYDCFYIAVALQRGGIVVTADTRFFEAAQRDKDTAHLVRLLGRS